jgi:hypothetical protein
MEPLLRELLCTRESRPCYLIELTWKLPNGLIALISLLNYSHVSQQGPKLVPALVGEQMPILSVISNSNLEILPLQIACTILVAELTSSQCSTVRIRTCVKKRLFAYLQTAPPVVAVAVRKQCYTHLGGLAVAQRLRISY